MPTATTEMHHDQARGLDALPAGEALVRLWRGQCAAAATVETALPGIEAASQRIATALKAGGRLAYVGAGSSALMAMADALELPGTYGIDPDRILMFMAGGLPAGTRMEGAGEDDEDAGTRAADALRPGDAAIAVTASGSTPYVIGFARRARAAGVTVIGIANNAGAALFGCSDVAVCLPTPPELVAGSTRMGAGTAQKIALNLLSTLAAIRLGHVLDGMMVNLVADNDKLRARARGIVAALAGVPASAAEAALATHRGAVKPAVLGALGATAGEAERLLAATEGNLRAAIARFTTTGGERRDPRTNQGSKT